MSQIQKMEVIFTDVEGKRTKVLETFLPHVEFTATHPINTFYAMGKFEPIHEHTGMVEFQFKGSGLTIRPRKAKKAKPLSKRALRKLQEQQDRADSMEEWE